MPEGRPRSRSPSRSRSRSRSRSPVRRRPSPPRDNRYGGYDRYNSYYDRRDERYDPYYDRRGPPPQYFAPPTHRKYEVIKGTEIDRTTSTTLYIGNLPYSFTEEDVVAMFSPMGKIESCSVPLDRITGKNKGFSFLKFEERQEAQAAMDKYAGVTIEGRQLRIDWDIGRDKKEQVRQVRYPESNQRRDYPPRDYGPPSRRDDRYDPYYDRRGPPPRDSYDRGMPPPSRDFNDHPPPRDFGERPPPRDFHDRPPPRDFSDRPSPASRAFDYSRKEEFPRKDTRNTNINKEYERY